MTATSASMTDHDSGNKLLFDPTSLRRSFG
jgi:hypothetical protein